MCTLPGETREHQSAKKQRKRRMGKRTQWYQHVHEGEAEEKEKQSIKKWRG
jgi:hypothetical protein